MAVACIISNSGWQTHGRPLVCGFDVCKSHCLSCFAHAYTISCGRLLHANLGNSLCRTTAFSPSASGPSTEDAVMGRWDLCRKASGRLRFSHGIVKSETETVKEDRNGEHSPQRELIDRCNTIFPLCKPVPECIVFHLIALICLARFMKAADMTK